MLSFFPRDVLDEIWDLNVSVSDGFPTIFNDMEMKIYITALRESISLFERFLKF